MSCNMIMLFLKKEPEVSSTRLISSKSHGFHALAPEVLQHPSTPGALSLLA
jgi:hypothetical protein